MSTDASQASRVDEILLPKSIAEQYDAEAPFNSLKGIKRLNAFVGPNNSGKSRLLRHLFLEQGRLLVGTTDDLSQTIRNAAAGLVTKTNELTQSDGDCAKLEQLVRDKLPGYCEISGSLRADRSVLNKIPEITQSLNVRYGRNPNQNQATVSEICIHANALRIGLGAVYDANKGTAGQASNNTEATRLEPKHVYIPTLRGMRLSADGKNLSHAYFDRTRNDYFPEWMKVDPAIGRGIEAVQSEHHGKTVFTGLNLYDWLTDKLLGDLTDRKFVVDYQQFLSNRFFQSQPVMLIPRRPGDTVYIKVGHEKERSVEHLGDGLQQLIILTLPLFEHRSVPLFLFIEEPDLFLHPGYQRVLIDTILDDPDRELYVFVTTHSSQFLDITLPSDQCAVFRFDKIRSDSTEEAAASKFSVRGASHGDLALLEHIGVKPSSIMLANCTIWVEGITDRLYFRRFIELAFADSAQSGKFIEGLHYSFVEYGGANITHWSFLDESGINVDRLCAKCLVICDKDGERRSERHAKLEEALGDRFIQLPVSEVENLLIPKVIQKVIQSYDGPDIGLKDFTQDQYADVRLGTFIDEHVIDNTKQKARGYADKSGTVKDKSGFCKKALLEIKEVGDLSPAGSSVAKQICAFIVNQNQWS